MPWLLILRSPWTWTALAFAAIGIYAAAQHMLYVNCRADFAQFRADVQAATAKAEAQNALERARLSANAAEAVNDLQTRLDRADARYASLRAKSGGSGSLPALSSAASSLSACPAGQPDAATRFLGSVESEVTRILEAGDRELAKYRELWALEIKNAKTLP